MIFAGSQSHGRVRRRGFPFFWLENEGVTNSCRSVEFGRSIATGGMMPRHDVNMASPLAVVALSVVSSLLRTASR